MSETTELSVIEIKPEQAPALYIPNGLDSYLEHIKASVSEAPDLSTDKGRKRVASLSASVSRSKTLIEKPGREYLKRLKEAVKPAEQEIKRFVDACDALRDEVRRPLTEWEAEQEVIRLAKLAEADHEVALLMNDKFDRDVADAKVEAERIQKEHEERIAKEAEEKVRLEAEATAQRERDAALQREADLKAQAALAEANRIAAEKKAEQDRIDAANKAESDRLVAAQQAEREKQEAIAAEQLKAKQEAERIQRETKQKEDARLAEEKRIADEAAARAANIEHQKAINNQVIAILTKAGISPDCAKECVIAIVKNQNAAAASGLPAPVQINY